MTATYHVYLIRRTSKTGRPSYYTGYTNNPARRWDEHRSGKTRANKGYTLHGMVVVFQTPSRKDAMKFERMIKKGWTHAYKRRQYEINKVLWELVLK